MTLFNDNVENVAIIAEPGTGLLSAIPHARIISVYRSKNVTLRNLSIDFLYLPFTQGTVKEIIPKEKSIVWKKDSRFPSPISKHFNYNHPRLRKAGGIYDKKGHESKCYFWLNWDKKTIKVDSGIYKTFVVPRFGKSLSESVLPGDKIFINARCNGSPCIDIWYSNACKIKNIDIFVSAGAGILVRHSSDTEITGYRVGPLPGSKRLTSTLADAINVHNSTKTVISNCVIERHNDDCINHTAQGKVVLEVINKTELIILWNSNIYNQNHPNQQFSPGHDVTVYSAKDGRKKGKAKVWQYHHEIEGNRE